MTNPFLFTRTAADDAAMWNELSAAEAKRQQIIATGAATAQAVGDFHLRTPHADPGVALAVGQGVSSGQVSQQQADQIANTVDQQAAAGNAPAWDTPEKMAAARAMSDKQIFKTDGTVDAAATAKAAGVAPPGSAPGGGFDWSNPFEALTNPGGAANVVGSAVKGATREMLSVAQSGYEMGTNEAIQGLNRASDAFDDVKSGDLAGAASYLNPFKGRNELEAVQATNVGQQISQARDIGTVDLGSGFFPSGSVTHTLQPAAAREARGVMPGTETLDAAGQPIAGTGQAKTLGRMVTGLVYQPGSKQYDVMSGLIDGVSQWTLDPSLALADAAHTGQVLEAARGLEEAPQAAEELAKAAPPKVASLSQQVGTALSTPEGKSVVLDLKNAQSKEAVAAIIGADIGDGALQRIADTDNWGKIRGILKANATINPAWGEEFSKIGGDAATHVNMAAPIEDVQSAAKNVLVNAERPTVVPTNSDQFLDSRPVQGYLQTLADNKNPLVTAKRLGPKAAFPTLVSALTNGSTVDEMKTAFRGELGLGVRTSDQLPGLGFAFDTKLQAQGLLPRLADNLAGSGNPVLSAIGEAGESAGAKAQRLMATVPSSQAVNDAMRWDATAYQQRDGLAALDNYMKTVGVDPATRANIYGTIADDFTKGTPEAKFHAVTTWAKAMEGGLKASGLQEEAARQIMTLFPDRDFANYGVTQLTKGAEWDTAYANGQALDLSQASPAMLSQGMDSMLSLPNPRELRRLTSGFGRLISDLDYNELGQAIGAKKLYGPLSWMQTLAEDIFPKLAVGRAATALRVTMDEQLRLAAYGLPNFITHPIQMIGLVAGSSRDLEKLGLSMEDIQAMQDEVAGSVFKSDAPGQSQRYTRATGMWTDVQRGDSRMVEAGLTKGRQLANDPIGRQILQGATTDEIMDWLHGGTTKAQTVEQRALADLQPGEGTLFHGTSRPWATEAPSDIYSGRSAENLMGAGLYTTDNPKVALSYTSKGVRDAETLGDVKVGPNGRVYQMTWKQAPRLLDLERPQGAVTDYLSHWVEQNRDAIWLQSTDEDWSRLERVVADPQATAAEQIKAWRATLQGLPMSEADDVVSNLAEHLGDSYDGLQYTGGVRTGNATHTATVVLHPENLDVVASHAPVNVTSTTEKVFVPGAKNTEGPRAFDGYKDLGLGAKTRDATTGRLIGAPVDLTDDNAMRNWIDTKVRSQVDYLTRGNTDLRAALGGGVLPDEYAGINDQVGAAPYAFEQGGHTPGMRKMMADWMDHPDSPDSLVWNRTTTDSVTKSQWDRMTNWWMSKLFNFPVKTLTRSPIFTEAFYQRYAELAPQLHPDEANQLLKQIAANADANGFGGKVADFLGGQDRLQSVIDGAKQANGNLTIADLEAHAKGYAVDWFKDHLYNVTNKTNLEQSLRAVAPFAHAWRQILNGWGKALAANPGIIRRFQVAVQGAQGSGFFYTDPVSGKQMFNYQGSAWMSKALTGGAGLPGEAFRDVATGGLGLAAKVPGLAGPISAIPGIGGIATASGSGLGGADPLSGEVQGLNMVSGSFLPGLGPMIQMPAAAILGNRPQFDWLRGLLMPYGVPSDQNVGGLGGTVAAYLAPAWAQKIYAAVATSPDSASTFGDTYGNVLKQKMASGAYGTSPEERKRLIADSQSDARTLTFLRGLGQFVSPSSPSYAPEVATKVGDVLLTELAKDAHDMQAEAQKEGDYGAWVQRFVDKYGQGPMIAVQAKTRAQNGGLDASTEFGNWEADHQPEMGLYPDVASYFAPVGSDFDFNVYNRQVASGERKRLSANEMLNATQATLGKWQYDQAKAQLGDHPTPDQVTWLAQVKSILQDKYPGYGIEPATTVANLPTKIDQLQLAAKDPKLKGDIQSGLSVYLKARSQALEVAKQRGSSGAGSLGGTNMADLRAWMSGVATAIETKYPLFSRLFDDVLSAEVS